MAAGAGTPRFEALNQALESGQVGSVEGLVATLPADLLSEYTLAFASRSLQGASYASPRAILFGTDATFIVTFNGGPPARGHATVETMEFDASASRFVLREIAFAANGDPAGRTISAPNPARCLACHGNPAQPIWDLPPSWPGIYGERYGAGLSAPEKAGIAAFLARQRSQARYAKLVRPERFAERATYVATVKSVYNGASIEPPNARLSGLLGAMNARAILAELASHPAFAAHRYVLLAQSSAGCGAPDAYYPAAEQAAVRRDFLSFRQRSLAADAREAGVKARRRAGTGSSTRGAGATSELEALRFVTERGLGLSTAHWSLALEHGAAAPSAAAGASTLEQGLFEMIAAGEAALADRAAYRGYTPTDGYCAYLRRASRSALSAWYEGHPVAPAAAVAPGPTGTPPLALVERCAGCHTGDVAPAIPFTRPEALASRLLEGDYPHGRLLEEILYRLAPAAGAARMPRGTSLGAADQQALEDYFVSLAPGIAAR